MPLFSAGLEKALNTLLYKERCLHAARQRLVGRVLKIELKEVSSPFVLLFSEQQVDVFGEWKDTVDCALSTDFSTLYRLRDRQKLPLLLRSGELNVDGDLTVLQHFVALLDLVEKDPIEWLAPYIGDLAAEALNQSIRKGITQLRHYVARQQGYLSDVVIEEQRLAPSALEVVNFVTEVEALVQQTAALIQRLDRMETQS